MNQYLQQLNDLAAQNEGGDPSAGGPFDTNPISSQVAGQQQVQNYGIPSGGARSYAGQPQMGGGYMVDVDSLTSSGLPQLMSQDRAVIDPALAVQMGASSQTGSAVFGGSVATPTAGEAPGQEEPQRERRRGGGATWEAPGEAMELTQEDFYTTPPPMVGQYDTGNEYVARSARMPMGALSKAAATLQNRQLEIDQKRQAFQEELYKPIKTATPYQQNFNAIVNRQREEFLQKVAQDLTGGNINKAYREIFSNPRLRAQYRQLNADLEALGQRGAATFEKVTNYLNQAATNKIQSTPEQRQLANDIAMGLGGYSAADGTGGSFEKLINDMNRWDLMEGRDQYFKNTIGPSIKDFFQKTSGWELTGDGRYRFLTTTSKKNWDSHIRQLAVDMAVWQGYGSGDLPEEKIQDNINYLTNMLGQQVDQDVKHIDTYANISRGDGDGGGGDRSTYKYAYQKINPQGADFENVRKAMQEVGFYLPKGTTTLDSVSFQEVTGGKGGVPKVISIEGTSVIPLSAYRDGNGKLWLFAKEARLTGVVDASKDKDKKGPSARLSGDDVATMISTGDVEMDSLPTKLYPFDRYEDIVVKKFNINGDQINEIINERNPIQGKTKIPTYKEIKAKVPTLTEQEYNEMIKSEEGINMARKLMNP